MRCPGPLACPSDKIVCVSPSRRRRCPLPHSQTLDRVDLESNLYALVGAKLRAMGYKVRNVDGTDDVFGGYQAILFQAAPGLKPPPEWVTRGDPPVNGVYHGASDFRKDGEAVGW